MGKGKRNKNRNKANSPSGLTVDSKRENGQSHTESRRHDVMPPDGMSAAQRDNMPANEDVVVSENDNGSNTDSAANGVSYSNKGLIQALEVTPDASCQLISRSLMLLEHTLLHDVDPQVRKRALEAYSELVTREAEIALHEERNKRPGNYSNTGSGQPYPGRYAQPPRTGIYSNEDGGSL